MAIHDFHDVFINGAAIQETILICTMEDLVIMNNDPNEFVRRSLRFGGPMHYSSLLIRYDSSSCKGAERPIVMSSRP